MSTKQLTTIEFNPEQVDLIKSQIAPDATDNELKLFLYQAQRTGLDPLTRQIYCIHRNTKLANGQYGKKMTIQTSIDGFRVMAERSGDYAGQSEPLFEEQDSRIIKCKISVFRFRGEVRYEAAVGVAYFSEYVQADRDGKPSGLWLKMPHVMIAKVAEALALRKAYPQDLSGLYTSEEMEQQPNPNENNTVDTPHELVPDEPELAAFEKHIRIPQENISDIEMLLQACENVGQLNVLFTTNDKIVKAHPALKEQFTNRKNELKNVTAA